MHKTKNTHTPMLLVSALFAAFFAVADTPDPAVAETYIHGNIPANVEVVTKTGVVKIATAAADETILSLVSTNLTYTLTTDATPVASRTYYTYDGTTYTPVTSLSEFEDGVDYYVYSHTIALERNTWNWITITNNADITFVLPTPKAANDRLATKSSVVGLIVNFVGDDPTTVTVGWDLNGSTVYQLTANSTEDLSIIKGGRFIHFIEVKPNDYMIQASRVYPYDFVRPWSQFPEN